MMSSVHPALSLVSIFCSPLFFPHHQQYASLLKQSQEKEQLAHMLRRNSRETIYESEIAGFNRYAHLLYSLFSQLENVSWSIFCCPRLIDVVCICAILLYLLHSSLLRLDLQIEAWGCAEHSQWPKTPPRWPAVLQGKHISYACFFFVHNVKNIHSSKLFTHIHIQHSHFSHRDNFLPWSARTCKSHGANECTPRHRRDPHEDAQR